MLKPTAANTVRLILICLVCSTHAAHADTRELFDGETLSGWQGDPNYWRVSDGAIVGEIAPGTSLDHNTWLIWQGEVADFELTFRFRLTGAAEANSGVQFRCQAEGVDHVSGYQADIDKGTVWLGRIYDEHGRALIGERGRRTRIATDGKRKSETFAPAASYRVLFREQDWNDYRLVVKGTHFLVYVNGTLFNELQDEQLPDRDLQGQLAFQLHSGPETKIELRDILLRDIPADEAFPNLQFRLPGASGKHRCPDRLRAALKHHASGRHVVGKTILHDVAPANTASTKKPPHAPPIAHGATRFIDRAG